PQPEPLKQLTAAQAPSHRHDLTSLVCQSPLSVRAKEPEPKLPAESEGRPLALATGGTEKSWYRCIFPFGIVSLVIGVAATCITFIINGPQMDIAKAVSVATLMFGVGLLVAAYICWRAKRERQRQRQREEPLPLEQGAL
uniref:Transmembrane protein 100 n=1 Tax=Gopherus evgoodei TaxID=1825980 RepID=A0A8C4YQG7_9SAUR